jgi:DedD protein
MDQGLKERLIGAAVLVALGVWLIPWLLDGRQEQVELASPSSSAVRLPAPDSPLPFRQQTLSLEAAKSDASAPEPHSEPSDPVVPAASVAADTPVVAAETTPAPTPPAQETAPPKPSAPAQESAAPPKQIAPTPVKPITDRNTAQRVASAAPVAASKPTSKPAGAGAQPGSARGDWAVQLGSFGAEDNAKKLAEKVKVYGYKPEVAGFRASGRAMYRVRLGPYTSRAEADATASALSAHGFAPQVVAAD